MTDHDLRPPLQQKHRPTGTSKWLVGGVVIAVAAAVAWYTKDDWLTQETVPVPTPPAIPATPPEPETVAPEQAVPAAPLRELTPQTEPGPQHPVPEQAGDVQPVADAASLDRWAVEWLGKPALKFLMLPGLAHHVVATIDNLPRSHAAPRLWPLSPVGGKILLEEGAEGQQIAPANSARYDAVVDFVTGIAPAQAASWYRQAYPVLQTTYEELGYPGKYFNDRLVEVIDHLLLTPEPAGPLAVTLVQVQGQIAPQQPWLRYEYADPQLQSLSAGQKILLRLGAEHRQRLKTYLQDVRAQVAGH